LKNIDFSLFFKANLLLTIGIFLLFLQYNSEYDAYSFTLILFGAVSSGVIFYILLYLILYLFRFTGELILYLSGVIFMLVDIGLVVDFLIFRLYGFHINAMVINIITSPDAMDSIQLGFAPIWFSLLMVWMLAEFELYLIKKITNDYPRKKERLNRKLNGLMIAPFILIVLSEKVAYGMASLENKNDILAKFEVIPLYLPLTFNRLVSKWFDYKPDVQSKTSVSKKAKLNYPIEPIKISKNPNRFNIFIIASDAVRNSILSQEVSPHIEAFKENALVFENHQSGGNATRFGIFSLIYGVNASYWFSFLNSAKPPVLFDILKKLDYQIDIISSTNTNWPEFRKTCYVDVLDSIKDDFEGKPWEKDKNATDYLLDKIRHYDSSKPIFSFIFFDSPHGYSFPPNENIFDADGENINYLTISKDGRDIKSALSGYKNAVHYDDKLFGQIVTKLKAKGLYDNSMIIFTSDHGQEFYEYGNFGHNSAFSKAQVNSPMIIKLPRGVDVELPVDFPKTLTSHIDIVPTILSLIGVDKNSTKNYSNGYNIFDKEYHRESAFVGNWNNSAVVTPEFTYIFSNLPNKMFKNSVRDNLTYKVVKDKRAKSSLLLQVMDDNRRFLK